MHRDVTIQKARSADFPRLLKIQKEAFQSEARRYRDETLPPLVETTEDLARYPKDGVILKALVADQLVGSVRGRMQNGVCKVARLSVAPSMQRRGVGRALMLALHQEFPQASFEIFTGHRSVETLRLYRSLGYEAMREEKQSDDLTLVFLRKK